MRRSELRSDALLLVAAAIWGSGFVAQRLGMQHVGPMTFNAIRFAIGGLCLLPIIRWLSTRQRRRRDELADATLRTYFIGGIAAGLALTSAVSLQQAGLVYTTAGKGGFITGLYVVFVPIFGAVIGTRTRRETWLGASLAVGGLCLLSLAGPLDVNPGDALVLAGAMLWALHVLVIGHYAPRTAAVKLAAVQFAITALLSAVMAIIIEPVSAQSVASAGPAILYSGVLSVGVAFTLQVVAQQGAPPAHAAVLLSLEAVFAALCGWMILGEVLSWRELIGCSLMLAGMLISQIAGSRK